jgi:hypothetical protein
MNKPTKLNIQHIPEGSIPEETQIQIKDSPFVWTGSLLSTGLPLII